MYLIRMACVGRVAWPGREGLWYILAGGAGETTQVQLTMQCALPYIPSHAPHMALMQP